MFKVNHAIVVCLLLIGSTVEANDRNRSLKVGMYDLKLLTPDMPARNKEITVPAEVRVENDVLEVHTQGMLGNKITLKGAMSDGKVKMGMTAIEKNSILSFHYLGTVDEKGTAKGKFFAFIDGKQAFAGEWTLSSRKDERQK